MFVASSPNSMHNRLQVSQHPSVTCDWPHRILLSSVDIVDHEIVRPLTMVDTTYETPFWTMDRLPLGVFSRRIWGRPIQIERWRNYPAQNYRIEFGRNAFESTQSTLNQSKNAFHIRKHMCQQTKWPCSRMHTNIHTKHAYQSTRKPDGSTYPNKANDYSEWHQDKVSNEKSDKPYCAQAPRYKLMVSICASQ